MRSYSPPPPTIVKRVHAKTCRDRSLYYAGRTNADRTGRIGNGGWVFHRYRCAHWRLADPCLADVLVWHGAVSALAETAMKEAQS